MIGCAWASIGCTQLGVLPDAPNVAREAPSSLEQRAIEAQPVCVGATTASVGDLGETLYYRAMRLPDGKVAVGYFAFYSEERPWGNNWLTWTVLPALGIDLVYSRSLLVGPGLQRALYGKGDVEGFRIVYDVMPDGSLSVDYAAADDALHQPVRLEREDVLAVDPKTPTVYSRAWSHQLGARGVRSRSELASLHCFAARDIRPLPEDVAHDFSIDRRAHPAHVEELAGIRLDGTRRQASSAPASTGTPAKH